MNEKYQSPMGGDRPGSIEKLKVPPHSIEAEQCVIGGLLISPDAFDTVSDKVSSEDFYNRAHRDIYRIIVDMMMKCMPVDLITLSDRLEELELLESCGGFAYLGELAKNTPSVANIVAYAGIVRERAVSRELIAAAYEIAEASYNPLGRDAKSLADLAETRIAQVSEKRIHQVGGKGPILIDEAMGGMLNHLEKLVESNREITGVSTGYTDLDKMTSGLQASDLIIVAARPSMGKTTFAMNLCESAMFESELPVMVFSLEMPSEQIMMRFMASQARIPLTNIRTAQLDDEHWARMSNVLAMVKDKSNLIIDDSSGLTPWELRARARKEARKHGGLSMIMVDYLQLMRVPGMEQNRTLEIAEISRSLKALAKELNVPVVALSQLNRSLENRSDKRPMNSDLRESGSIEQDADLILFIYRDEVYHENTQDKGVAEIIIGKQRNGPIGTVRLAFRGEFSRFENYAFGRD